MLASPVNHCIMGAQAKEQAMKIKIGTKARNNINNDLVEVTGYRRVKGVTVYIVRNEKGQGYGMTVDLFAEVQ